MSDLDKVVSFLKARVDRRDPAAAPAVDDLFLEVLQQHVIEAADLARRLIIAPHEGLHARVAPALIAERFGHAALQLKQQALLAPPGQRVQGKARAPEQLSAGL